MYRWLHMLYLISLLLFLGSFADDSKAALDEEDDDDEEDGLSINDLDFFAEDEVGETFDEEELKRANTPYDERNSDVDNNSNKDFEGIQLPIVSENEPHAEENI